MKRTIFFALAMCSTLSAPAQTLKVESFALDSLHLDGSYCQFGMQNDTLIASDWSHKFWMKIDGEMVEFESERTDAEAEAQLKNKRWRERLKKSGITVQLNLIEAARGDDTATFRGYVDVARNGLRKHISIAGGCGA